MEVGSGGGEWRWGVEVGSAGGEELSSREYQRHGSKAHARAAREFTHFPNFFATSRLIGEI